MKNSILYKIIPLLLLAFFNAFSSFAVTYTPFSLDLDSRNYDYLQADQNTSALLLSETISFTIQQNKIKDFSDTDGHSIAVYTISSLASVSANKNPFEYLQDGRYHLEHQIFPFHYFW